MVASEVEVPDGAVRKPFRLRGGNFTLLVLPLADLKDQDFFRRLLDQVSQAPNFFHNAPVVLDLEGLSSGGAYNFAELGRRLRQLQLVPVGVQNGTDEQNKAAVNAGMSVLPPGQPTALRRNGPPSAVAETSLGASPPLPNQPGAQVITAPVRSGRQIYAYQRDLVALASVSPGAELLADGHIHVYGTLRGRALAGVTGNTAARIFCRKLEAELISISGYWQVRDNIDERLIGQPVQIFLDGGRLRIEPLA